MAKGLRYTDAVELLTGDSPAASAIGTAVSGLAGAAGVPSLFDVKSLTTRIAKTAAERIRDRSAGVSRLDRSRRLEAAHAILVVTAFFDGFDALGLPIRAADIELTREDQAALAGGPRGEGWLAALLEADVPAPGPVRPFADHLEHLVRWYAGVAARLHGHLLGLSLADALDETGRRWVRRALTEEVPGRAAQCYEAAYLRLAADVAEFGMWVWRADADAKDAALGEILSALDPERERAALRGLIEAAHRADVERPVAGDEQDTSGSVVPSLRDSYVTPRFLVRAGGRADNPANEEWWQGLPAREDLLRFVAAHLLTPDAAAAPVLVLGHPGSGKSALARMLGARLGEGDFMAIRVPLREVPADADVQDQIEAAVRLATGERVAWPEVARAAAGALPVVVLDGLDELLQATGVGRSDYLLRAAQFQRQQAALGRPLAVLVTSRVAVANRAPLPDGATVVRLEPFDHAQIEAWLAVWNRANAETFAGRGVRPLDPATVLCWPELAAQPLLLFMLALYDGQDNALQAGDDARLTRSALYERLLCSFAEREVRKERPAPRPGDVEAELLRLSVVAFAMLNRDRQWATADELDADLGQLDLAGPAAPDTGFTEPQSAGERALARFFFVHRAQAVVHERERHTYEFLHATFGDFLAARLVARIVADALARDAAGTSALRPAAPHDDLLYALLGHAPLTGQGATILSFAAALLDPAAYDWLCRAFRLAATRLDVPDHPYRPVPQPAGHRLVRYGLNLVLLAACARSEVSAADLFPGDDDPAERLGRAAHGWQSALGREQWLGVIEALRARRDWAGGRHAEALRAGRGWASGRRDLRLRLDDGPDPAGFDAYWNQHYGPGSDVWTMDPGSGFNGAASADRAAVAVALRADGDEDLLCHAIEPLRAWSDPALTSFVVHGPQDAESVAHSLVRAWVATAGPDGDLVAACERLVRAVTGYGWGEGIYPEAARAIDLAIALLTAHADRLPPERMTGWLLRIVACNQTTPAQSATVNAYLERDAGR
ncbi:MAG TPA: hypothetical protein VL738_33485 [Dactylosporangium sp.]|nr:hypothetical protein [Dactylosporangium sp.]